MKVIDADAHVIENESTWDYMLESEKAFKPKIVGASNGKDAFDYWMIDGRVIPRNNVGRDLPVESREMSDLSARIKHMDELGIDVQVIYPTFFITPVSRRPDIDLAVSRSYNRWMADIVKKQPDRFRWVLVPPLQSQEHLSEELKFGKENGACGVYMRGLECERSLSDPYFYSLYEQASALDLPICVHSANGAFTTYDFFADDPGFSKFKLAVIGAFHSLVFHAIPQRFPEVEDRHHRSQRPVDSLRRARSVAALRPARPGVAGEYLERKSHLRDLPDRRRSRPGAALCRRR